MGSSNHFSHPEMKGLPEGGDFGKGLMEFIRGTVDKYTWVIMGGFPQELNDIKDKIEYHSWEATAFYPAKAKSLKLDLAIAPLEPCRFNEGKSNIKLLEYTALGIPGVFTDITPYRKAPCKAKNDEEMIAQIEKLATDRDYWTQIRDQQYEVVKSDLWWEENDNILKYINVYLEACGWRIP